MFLKNKLNSSAIFTLGSLFKTGVQIVANFFILAYIEPRHLGVFNTFVLFQSYALLLQGGVINGLNRELPFSLGAGQEAKAIGLASTAMVFTFFSMGITIIAGVLFYLKLGQDHYSKISIITIIILTTFKFYENYLTSTFLSNQAFAKLGKAYFLRGLIGLISILLVIHYSYEGHLVRLSAISLTLVMIMYSIRPIKGNCTFKTEELKLLLTTGFPIFVIAYIYTVAKTADRFFLAYFYNSETVGYYSFGLMTYSVFLTLPITLANYIYPRFSFAVGKRRKITNLVNNALAVNKFLFIVLLLIALVGYFMTPWVINSFFPKYIQGIQSTRILLFAAVFAGSTIGGNIIWSLKKWRSMVIIQIGGGAIAVLSIWTALHAIPENPLLGASLGVLIGNMFYYVISNYLTYTADP